jgi:hypothetical protein
LLISFLSASNAPVLLGDASLLGPILSKTTGIEEAARWIAEQAAAFPQSIP